MLSPDLIARIRSRAGDHARRTDTPDTAPETSFLGGAFTVTRVSLGGEATAESAPPPLPQPATPDAIEHANARLGFALPDELAQLYVEVADGGFGPNDGLAPLDDLTARYADLTANPPGENGQAWPAHLLPIGLATPGLDCFDLKTGKIVYWDEDSLADGPSDRVWRHSFKTAANSLSAWLEGWVGKPSLAETQHQNMERVLVEGTKSTVANLRAMSAAERHQMGLSERDVSELISTMCGKVGLDPHSF